MLTDMTAAASWPLRVRLAANALSAAVTARLTGQGGTAMPDGVRRPMAAAAWAAIAFVIAGIGFQKMTEDPAFTAAGRTDPALPISFGILIGAAVAAGLAGIAVALPPAWSVARQALAARRPGLILPLVIPPAAILAWLGVVRLLVAVHGPALARSGVSLTDVHVVVVLGLLVAGACGWSAEAILRRADVPARLLRPQAGGMSVLAACMAVVTAADLSWGLALRSASAALFRSDNGLLATPLPPTWIGSLVVLAAATAVTAVAAARAMRGTRRPAGAPGPGQALPD